MRPSYWVEPHEDWGEGRVELVELPTPDETNDNIVAYWVPKDPLEPGKQVNLAIASRRASISRGCRPMRGRSTRSRQIRGRSARRSRAKPMRAASSSISQAATSLITCRSGTGRGRAVDEPGPHRPLLHRCQRGDQGDSRDNRRAGRTPAKPLICAPSCAPPIGRSPRRGRFRGRRSEAGRAARDHGSQRHACRSRSPGGDRKRRVPRRPADAPLAARASDKADGEPARRRSRNGRVRACSWVCADRIPQGRRKRGSIPLPAIRSTALVRENG